MSSDVFLKYKGPSVDDGSISAIDLISGLQGLIKLSSVVLPQWNPSGYRDVTLQIKGIDKGSVVAVLNFIEKHPVLIGSVTAILTTSIASMSYYITQSEKKQLAITEPETLVEKARRVEMERTVDHILGDSALMKKTKEGFHYIAMPLRDKGIIGAEFGTKEKMEEIVNQQNKNCFLPDYELEPEEIHELIEMKGFLRMLDKKTLKGKFISEEREAYQILLRMRNPSDFFHYFARDSITIKGVAIYEKGSDTITRIEIGNIVDK